jgi:integrase
MRGSVLPDGVRKEVNMKHLVRLRKKPSRDGSSFKYFIDYSDENGKRRRISLGHADRRKAERQKAQKERELRMGVVAVESMKLSDFLSDSLSRTGDQIRESTREVFENALQGFIAVVGNIDFQSVTLRHGELFRQGCLDHGNSPATVSKKLRALKRLFQLAVERKQLEENPLKYIKLPKSPKRKVETYTSDECERMLRATRECEAENPVQWDLLILIALTTAMRRGELLNAVWSDIDFESKVINVTPKEKTTETWEWHIKDTDRRTLPLTDEAVTMLSEHQGRQPEGYPYVFVPSYRYDWIQQLRRQGNWSLSDSRLKIINNFNREFEKILKRAGIRKRQFHDLRRTVLSNWLANGMSERDVMVLAGHSSFQTTHQFYLAVADDLVDRARQAISQNLARTWHAPSFVGQSS